MHFITKSVNHFTFGIVHKKTLNKMIFLNGDMNISSYFPMGPITWSKMSKNCLIP